MFPKDIADVWAERPLYFKGRYEHAGSGTVTLSGYAAGKPYKQTLNVTLPEENAGNAALASMWARAKVDRLMREDYLGAQQGNMKKELQDEITDTALKYHIMSQFTSFVAVDETSHVDKSGKTIVVPTEMVDGVSREMTLGEPRQPSFGGKHKTQRMAANLRMQAANPYLSPYSKSANNYFSAVAAPMPLIAHSHAGGAGAASAPPPPVSLQSMGFAGKSTAGEATASSDANVRGTLFHKEKSEESLKKADKPTEAKVGSNKISAKLASLLESRKDASSEIKVMIDLTKTDKETIAELKKAGFKIDSIDGAKKRAIGKIKGKDVWRLAKLAAVSVIDVAPQDS